MTYCLAMRLDAGLIFASDSRTSAGVDNVSIYSKMHRFKTRDDRIVVLLSAGNLATTQAVVNQINRDLDNPEIERDLNHFSNLDELTSYVGDISSAVQEAHADQAEQSAFTASFILGGQILGRAPDVFLVYPQGNHIAASKQRPFLQIGETKYGKPILDRIIEPSTAMEHAARCALVSMDASMRSNLSVGPPIELLLYEANTIDQYRELRFDEGDPFLRETSKAWTEGLDALFAYLPRFYWEPGG
ncbi:MAG: peptidase [Pseudomonadota bacterium]